MVKSAESRIAKYEAKFDSTVVASRYTAVKDLAVAEAGVRFAEGAQLEATVKQAIENLIESPTEIPNYLALARQVQSKANKYGGKVLWNEAQALKTTWVARGLTGATCDVILEILGITTALYGS